MFSRFDSMEFLANLQFVGNPEKEQQREPRSEGRATAETGDEGSGRKEEREAGRDRS